MACSRRPAENPELVVKGFKQCVGAEDTRLEREGKGKKRVQSRACDTLTLVAAKIGDHSRSDDALVPER
jgi:hypothetical protein